MSGRRPRAAGHPRPDARRPRPAAGRRPVSRRPHRRARRASKRAAWTDHAVDAAPCHELFPRGPALALPSAQPQIEETPMAEPLVVRRETQIAAPPATVFAFLTDPEKILGWMGTEAKTEMHPGGLYLLKGVGDRGRVARGAFREVVPVHRLAYSFGWDGD